MALPFEFVIDGPPVSQQARRRERVREWRDQVQKVAGKHWPSEELPVTEPVMLIITYFYDSVSMEPINFREKQRTRAIAEEYRSKGYTVIEDPTPDQLPDFLSGYRLDLLIKKGDEAKVIEVKSRSSLAKSRQIRDLARLLHNKPHWNFELVIVGEDDQSGALEDAHPLKQEDIQQGLETAEKLLASGFSEAALMQAWSISEAAVRLLTEAEGISLDQLTPLYILKQAVTNGVITREDYNFLTRVMKPRNALAHGFKTIDFDPALVKELVNTTKRLAQQSTVSSSGSMMTPVGN